MNLAILSCGPSLQPFLDHPVQHDSYMGVNRAAGAWACDTWVALDSWAFTETEPIGSPIIYTSDEYNRTDYNAPARCRVIKDAETFAGISAVCGLGPTPWRRWSAVYALVVGALVLKATTLTLYGYDMTGHLFWDGVYIYRRSFRPPPVTLEDVRWKHERSYFEQVVTWLRGRGVEVVKSNGIGAASVGRQL